MKGNIISIVRSRIPNEGDRARFDLWYGTDHMPKVLQRLKPEEGWRYWSLSDPAIHIAVYRYRDRAAIDSRSEEAYRGLVAEYDAAFPGIVRSNEWFEEADHQTRA